jgi:hypothetical protein
MPRPIGMHTYVFACGGAIKVGRATNIKRRLRQVQLMNPLPVALLGTVDTDIERKAHVALEYAGIPHIHGEWFKDSRDAREILVGLGLLTDGGA